MKLLEYDPFDGDLKRFTETLIDLGFSSIRFACSPYAPEDKILCYVSPKVMTRIIEASSNPKQ